MYLCTTVDDVFKHNGNKGCGIINSYIWTVVSNSPEVSWARTMMKDLTLIVLKPATLHQIYQRFPSKLLVEEEIGLNIKYLFRQDLQLLFKIFLGTLRVC